MLESVLSSIAALATIATFLLEARRLWKELRPSKTRKDDVEDKE